MSQMMMNTRYDELEMSGTAERTRWVCRNSITKASVGKVGGSYSTQLPFRWSTSPPYRPCTISMRQPLSAYPTQNVLSVPKLSNCWSIGLTGRNPTDHHAWGDKHAALVLWLMPCCISSVASHRILGLYGVRIALSDHDIDPNHSRIDWKRSWMMKRR